MSLYEIEQLFQMDTFQLYNLYLQMLNVFDDNKELLNSFKDDINSVKYGINIKVPMFKITKEHYKELPSSRKVLVSGYGYYDENVFNKEMEDRCVKMRNFLIQVYDDDTLTEGRTT